MKRREPTLALHVRTRNQIYALREQRDAKSHRTRRRGVSKLCDRKREEQTL
jgi:hypothetical protein